jgi:hypothetical protein
MANWYTDLKDAFDKAFPEDEAIRMCGELPGPFYMGILESLPELAEQKEVDVVHAVEYGDQQAFLIAREPHAWLLWFEEPGSTTALFLGDLRGGRYRERITIDDAGDAQVAVTYEHDRLGRDKALSASFPAPTRRAGAFTSTETDNLVGRGRLLRQVLRDWASSR